MWNPAFNSDNAFVMLTGLGGSKPPPLNMLGSSVSRSTATVTPMSAVSPGTSVHPTAQPRHQQQQPCFAAALRKLAKQAEGPDTSPGDQHSTPSDSLNTSPRDSVSDSGHQHQGKHSRPPPPIPPPPSMSYPGSHPALVGGPPPAQSLPGPAPPVVTIAPTPAHSNYINSERKPSDRSAPNALHDPLGVKLEHDKMMTPAHERSREDGSPRSKDSTSLSARMTPHPVLPTVSSGGSSSVHDDPSRGFQPYRPLGPSEDPLRHSAAAGLPFGLAGIDPATYSAYAQAAAAAAALTGYPPSSPYTAHSLRSVMEDPMLLERYRLMQSGYGYPPTNLMPPPGLSQYLGSAAAVAAGRYPPELLSQLGAYPYLYGAGKLPEHLSPGAADRLKSEEDLRIERERELEREREREREKERERERREKEERERLEKLKETERRHSAGSRSEASHNYHSSFHPAPPPANEPLNLKRGSDEDPRLLHRHINGDRSAEHDRLLSYRPDLSRTSEGTSARTSALPPHTHPSLLPPPTTKPMSSSQQAAKDRDTHHFHRPFEIPSASSSSSSRAAEPPAAKIAMGTHPLQLPLLPPNGYDANSYAEYERKLLMEREKMLAEHRAAQEKLQQQRTNKDSDSRHRTSSIERDHHQSAPKNLNITNHHDQKSSLLHPQQHISSSIPSPYKNSPSKSTMSSNNNNTKLASSNHHPHRQVLHQYGKESSSSKPGLDSHLRPQHPHTPSDIKPNHNYNPANSSQSALNSLQNFSNSKLPTKFGIMPALDLEMERKLKDIEVSKPAGRVNGAYDSHLHHLQVDSADKRKNLSVHHNHNKNHGLKSPKRVRSMINSHSLNKEKLEDGEPPPKQPHLGDYDSFTMVAQREIRADELNREPDYREKACFLFALELEPVPPEKRKLKEFSQKVCEYDKFRRDKWSSGTTPRPPCHADHMTLPYHYTTAKLTQLLVEAEFENNQLIKLNSQITKLSSSPNQQLPVNAATSSMQKLFPQPAANSRSVIYNTSSNGSSNSGKNSVLSSNILIDSSKTALNNFAQEFHESVLKETQQQRANKAFSNRHEKSQQDVRYTLISESEEALLTGPDVKHLSPSSAHSKGAANFSSSLQSMQIMASQLIGSQGDSRTPAVAPLGDIRAPAIQNSKASSLSAHHSYVYNAAHKHTTSSTHGGSQQIGCDIGRDPPLKWPGETAVMESYHKHDEEARTEKQILEEQCSSLEHRKRQLTKTMEEMRYKLTDLMQNKKKMEEDRGRHQNKLDKLRKLVLALKR